MKIKKKNIFCLIVALSLFAKNVDAATLVVGNDTAGPNEKNKSVTVELKDNDLNLYNKVEFGLSISGTSYVEYNFEPKVNGANIAYNNSNDVYTFTANSGELFASTVGTVTYSTKENLVSDFKIVPTDVKFYKEDGTVVKMGETGVKIVEGAVKFQKPKSHEAFLTDLTVSQGQMTPEFNKDVTEYTVTVPDTINMLKILATPTQGATRVGTGNKSLVMGENKFEINVVSEDEQNKKVYTITINRGEISKPSAYLEDLKINNIGVELSPKFDKMNNKYTVSATSDVKELDLKYELEDKNAKIDIEGNSNLKPGENLIQIKIKSSDEKEEQTYQIVVNIDEEESKPESKEEEKKEEKKKNNIPIIIGVVITVVLIIGILIYIFFKNKNNKNGNANKKNKNLTEKPAKEPLKEEIIEEKEEMTDTIKTIPIEKKETIDELEKTKEFSFSDFK